MQTVSTILVSLILMILVFFIIRSMRNDRRNKTCGGGCGDCCSLSVCHAHTSFVDEYRKDYGSEN